MKREKITYPIVKKVYMWLFWSECRFCNREFKREHGFVIDDKKICYGSGSSPYYTSYCCNECAKDIKEVKELIKKEKETLFKSRPKFPKVKDKPRDLEHHICKNCDYYCVGRCVWHNKKVNELSWCKNYTKY